MITRSRVEALEDEIKELRKTLTEDISTYRELDYSQSYHSIYYRPMKTIRKATILGKVDAIIEHLGIDIEVAPPKESVTIPAKIVIKSRTAATKRKYVKSDKYSKKSKND
jgi:hypothetical protein